MIGDSIAVDEALLALKIAFLVLLYLFIWRIVRTASKDIRIPQESFVLGPTRIPELGTFQNPGRLVVIKSPSRPVGEEHSLDSTALTVGRSPRNDVELGGDQFASASHARFEPRRDGVWVEDIGSTNGTFVNGIKLGRGRKLTSGDVVRVGETDLRYDE